MYFRLAGFIWLFGIIIYGLYKIITTANRNGAAQYFAAYMAGVEVLFRMLHVTPIWETGKYIIILFLTVGFIVQGGKKVPVWAIWYFGLLVPSIFLLDLSDFNTARQALSFNLAGPLTLAVSAIYFYDRKITKEELGKILRSFVYPVIAMLVVVAINSPRLEEIRFVSTSNVQTSGGFGANQVSTTYGGGICVIALGLLYSIRIVKKQIIDILIIVSLTFAALITFSRGGVFGALLSSVFMLGTYVLFTKKSNKIVKQAFQISIYFVLFVIVFEYINSISDNMLLQRFESNITETVVTEDEEYSTISDKYTSGRISIIKADLVIFAQNTLLGTGPGRAGDYRNNLDAKKTAHTEQTRMLSEHGLFGLAALIIMIVMPIRRFISSSNPMNKVILITLIFYSFFTMSHSATRIALPGLFYGLAFINISGENPLIRRKAKPDNQK